MIPIDLQNNSSAPKEVARFFASNPDATFSELDRWMLEHQVALSKENRDCLIPAPRFLDNDDCPVFEWMNKHKFISFADLVELSTMCLPRSSRKRLRSELVERFKRSSSLPEDVVQMAAITLFSNEGSTYEQVQLGRKLYKQSIWFKMLRRCLLILDLPSPSEPENFIKSYSDGPVYRLSSDAKFFEAYTLALVEALCRASSASINWESRTTLQKNAYIMLSWIVWVYMSFEESILHSISAIHPEIGRALFIEPTDFDRAVNMHKKRKEVKDALDGKDIVSNLNRVCADLVSAVQVTDSPVNQFEYISDVLEKVIANPEGIIPELENRYKERIRFFVGNWINDRKQVECYFLDLVSNKSPKWLEIFLEKDNKNLAIASLLVGVDFDGIESLPTEGEEWWLHYSGTKELNKYWSSYFENVFQSEVVPNGLEPPVDILKKIAGRKPSIPSLREAIQDAASCLDQEKISQYSEVLSERMQEVESLFECLGSHLTPSDDAILGAQEVIDQAQEKERESSFQAVKESELKAKIDDLSTKLEQAQSHYHKMSGKYDNLVQAQRQPSLDLDPRLFPALMGNLTMQNLDDALIAALPADAVMLEQSSSILASSDYRHPYRIMEAVVRITREYAHAIQNGVPDSEARHILGPRYRATESESTMSKKACRRQRTFCYQGKDHVFEQHITLGSGYGSAECVQIHFGRVEGITVIARIGPHLDTE